MIINSTPSILNTQTGYENNTSVVKTDVQRTTQSKSSSLAKKNELNADEPIKMDAGSLPVPLQQVKNLSFYFNTMHAYVNQIQSSDRLLNQITNGLSSSTQHIA